MMLLLLLGAARAARLPLSDKTLPYLGVDGGALLRWDGAAHLDALQRARIVEISPRGVRFVYDPAAAPEDGEPCAPERRCLCGMEEGLILPSPALDANNVSITVGGVPPSRSAVLRAFASATDACAYNAAGRNLSHALARYTVSGCDVLQGRLVIVYRPDLSRLMLIRQTLGPMAYTACILAALACFYLCTLAPGSTDAAVIALVLLAALPFVRTPFLTPEDQLHFLCSWALAACMAPFAIWRNDQQRAAEATLIALVALVDAIYRTPESPYAPLVCLLLTTRQWRKVIRLCQAKAPPPFFPDALDLLGTTFYLCFTVQLGLVPQLTHQEDWPIYAGAGTYVAFAGAFYQHHLQNKNTAPVPAK